MQELYLTNVWLPMDGSLNMANFNQELNLDHSTCKVDALPLCYYKWNNTFYLIKSRYM
jgi:hypothetical protein